jgi:hypothetical protein
LTDVDLSSRQAVFAAVGRGFEIAADPGDPEACMVKLAISNQRAGVSAH